MLKRILILMFILNTMIPNNLFAETNQISYSIDKLRMNLVELQLIVKNIKASEDLLSKTIKIYESISPEIAKENHNRISVYFRELKEGIKNQDISCLAKCKAGIWSNLLVASYNNVEKYIEQKNFEQAQQWLHIREYRKPNKYSFARTDATIALETFKAGKTTADETINTIRADLWDTYQSKFNKSLDELKDSNSSTLAQIELKESLYNYFKIFEKEYIKQRGSEQSSRLLNFLATIKNNNSIDVIKKIDSAMSGFKAAPLTKDEKHRLARQLQRFTDLISIEYGRGVKSNQVTKDFEIMEAISFRDGAESAFKDLEPDLLKLGSKTIIIKAKDIFNQLKQQLNQAAKKQNIVTIEVVKQETEQLLKIYKDMIPSEWLERSTAGDFEEIASNLDMMENAIAQGQYDLAETARLEAYAILDTGPEAKLIAFAPQYIPELENLFWHGDNQNKGLARLIKDKSSLGEIKEARVELNTLLNKSQKALGGTSSSTAVIANSAIIVFREGLEAVLIIAAMLAGFHRKDYNHLKKPLIWGVVLAFLATILTWILARSLLASLAQYGEVLEAIISLFAVIMLLLITNWFFHKSYWTGWLQGFQAKKWNIAGNKMGQITGMVLLGFDSVYREGFETVLFLQALVLDAGSTPVFIGISLGMLGVSLIGIALFKIQVKLPYKKMLIFTGALIVSVLVTMVGSTVHSFQVLGWLSTNPIRELTLPYWTGMWMGLYPTWEGILLQFFAGSFVIGSYFLATYLNRRKDEIKREKKKLNTAIAN